MNSNIVSSGNKLSNPSSWEVDDPTKANISVAAAMAVTSASIDAGIDLTNCKPSVSLAIALDSLKDGNSGQTTNILPFKLHPAGSNSDSDRSKLPDNKQQTNLALPPNAINADSRVIMPDMLPLIDLTQDDIDSIIQQVDGGLANIQDIYSPSPVQDGIIFHHIMAPKGDPYLTHMCMIFNNRGILDLYLNALQKVIDRHDIVRTAFLWKRLSRPAQVVLRHAKLCITEVDLDPVDGPAHAQLLNLLDPRQHKIDLAKPPLVRFTTSQDIDGRWVAVQAMHHVIGDQYTVQQFLIETQTIIKGYGAMLESPQPYRNLIAEIRLGKTIEEHEAFFTRMLTKVDTAAFPYDIAHTQDHRVDLVESRLVISHELISRLRDQGKKIGVSFARVCHLAWALVLAATSGQRKVVFGTVVSGRRQSISAGRALGPFINTLPICIDVDDARIEDALLRVHSTLTELVEHQHASLTLTQHCSNVPTDTPLFNSILNFRRSNNSIMSAGSKVGIHIQEIQERTNYPFSMTVDDGTEAKLICQTPSEVDPFNLCQYMEQALTSIADSSSGVLLQDLEILPFEERELLIKTWNQTKATSNNSQCTHRVFEQQVVVSPDAVAAVHDGQSLTYNELNERANKLANHLIGLGVKPDMLVALCVERSLAIVIGILAIHKAGGAYLPLDPVYASSRLQDIIVDAGPYIVIADALGKQMLGTDALSSLAVVDPNAEYNTSAENPQVPDLTSNHLAYVIYTSGSTGRPKGVMVEHAQVTRLFESTAHWFKFNSSDTWIMAHSFSFDFSVWEMWGALRYGGKLVIPDIQSIQSSGDLYELICSEGVSVLNLTPSAFRPLIKYHAEAQGGNQLRYVILGGEALEPSSLQSWFAIPRALPQVINMYGITETTVHVSYRVMTEADVTLSVSPIGERIPDLTIYILDSQNRPVPLGAIGELCIGGLGVSRGYLNRPELTSEKFPLDPFSDIDGARIYKTGDLARFLPNGELIYLGRNDHQVKIRGFRIELGEIEARLMDHKLVRESLVLAVGSESDKRLVAYVVADEIDSLAQKFRDHLTPLLPDYMVPAAFVRLDRFPLTPNGKLDRHALPEPERDAFASQAFEEPKGDAEMALAGIWSDLLKVDRISRHDNFFILGGHSLMAVRMINRLSSLGVRLQISTIFASPHLYDLAAALDGQLSQNNVKKESIPVVSRDGILPLSFAQQRLWFLDQMEGASATYNIPLAIRFQGPLNVDTFQLALNTLFARHESLRLVFVEEEGKPQVKILSAAPGVPSEIIELRNTPNAEEQLAELAKLEAIAPFDLATGPLIRSRLIRVADEVHILLLTQHHIVSDRWSIGVLLKELSELYSAFTAGQTNPLAPLSIQYPDYASWQREWLTDARSQEQSEFWKCTLADAPEAIALPLDHPRPSQQSFVGAQVPIRVDSETTTALKNLCQRHGVTLFMVVMVAWSAVLSRLSGQDDILIGTPTANRNHADIEQLIGFFVNTLVIRIDLSGSLTIHDLVERVRQQAIAAQAHQDLPFEKVVEIAQPTRRLDLSPLFQVMFAWQNNDQGSLDLPGITAAPFDTSFDVAKFDLELHLSEVDDGIVGSLIFSTALFERSTIKRHVGYLQAMLKAMATDITQSVTSVDLLSAEESEILISTWNEVHTPVIDYSCLHQIFESQVTQFLDAIAVVHEGQSLTYRELNERSN
ncbi:hypothetical protein BGX26_007800, partial [Mortierella sp. AD094]